MGDLRSPQPHMRSLIHLLFDILYVIRMLGPQWQSAVLYSRRYRRRLNLPRLLHQLIETRNSEPTAAVGYFCILSGIGLAKAICKTTRNF